MNNSGFALVVLIALLPLLATFACLISGLALVLYAQRISLHTCRAQMLEAQNELAAPLNSLLELNPQALLLHREYEAAKRTGETPEGAVWLAALLARMQILRARQSALLLQLETLPKQRLYILPRTLSGEFQARLSSSRALHVSSVSMPPTAIRFRRLDEILGTYETASAFERLQTRKLNWSLALGDLLPASFPREMREHLVIPGSCAATVFMKGRKWIPTLAPVKY